MSLAQPTILDLKLQHVLDTGSIHLLMMLIFVCRLSEYIGHLRQIGYTVIAVEQVSYITDG
jgi:hypothetical protein